MTDPITEVILYSSIVALVFLAAVVYLTFDKRAARDADAKLAAYDALDVPALPKFTCDLDVLVEFQGKKYRVFIAVADVQMVEGE